MKWLIGSSQWANMIRLTRSFHWNRLNERKNIQKKSECTFVWLAISFQSSMICREHGICLDYNKMSLIASLQHVPLHILTDICCRGGIIYLFVCLFIYDFIWLWRGSLNNFLFAHMWYDYLGLRWFRHAYMCLAFVLNMNFFVYMWHKKLFSEKFCGIP